MMIFSDGSKKEGIFENNVYIKDIYSQNLNEKTFKKRVTTY
jgi:hypothetical protein